jgi:teichuronic acid biosynthesis glycosyltransferase TuaC
VFLLLVRRRAFNWRLRSDLLVGKMLRIAIVTRYFPSSAEPWQGRSAYQTLRLLARETELHVFYPNAAYPRIFKPRSRIYSSLDSTFKTPDVNASYHDIPALPLLSRPLNGWMAARILLPTVRRFAPDLVFSFFAYPDGYAALKIGQALGIPVAVMSIGSDINNIGDPISAMHTRTVLRESDFMLTISENLRTKAVSLGANPLRSRSIINGCDLSVFQVKSRPEARIKLQIDPSAKVIVYIGRMDVSKGLRELVEAAASLRPTHPGLHVYLLGEGPDRPVIERMIQANNGAGYIRVMPGCSFDEVAAWMAAADLVTLPSYMEGCPNVVIEALACGRPVVATNVGGIPEILGKECGLLVPPRDPAGLADALATVLDGTWDARAISAHWSRSWSVVATELLEIFNSLVSVSKSGTIPVGMSQRRLGSRA